MQLLKRRLQHDGQVRAIGNRLEGQLLCRGWHLVATGPWFKPQSGRTGRLGLALRNNSLLHARAFQIAALQESKQRATPWRKPG